MTEFGPFRFDSVRRLLYRNGVVLDVPPKALSVLLTLIDRRGQVVDKEELMAAVWPNTVVEENNLARSISTLRKALGEKAGDHRYILTVPGQGYSFVGGEEVAAPSHVVSPADRLAGFHFAAKRSVRVITALVIIGIPSVLWISAFSRSAGRLEPVRLQQILTSEGYPSAGLSPDGKSIVYSAGDSERRSVRLRLIESGKEVELLPPSHRSYSGFTFTPDGRQILFLANLGTSANVLLSLPLAGGPLHEVTRELDSPPSLSPDGSQVAFVRETPTRKSALIRRSLADGTEHTVVVAAFPTFLDYPAWSPAGKSIAYTEVAPDRVYLNETNVNDGRKRSIGQAWRYIRGLAWKSRGDGILLSAMEPGSDSYGLWQVDRGNGSAQHVTENVDSLHSIVLSADGKRALTVAEHSLAAAWIGTLGARQTWTELLPASENVTAASWTSDGNVLIESKSAGGRSVRIVSPDGKTQTQVLRPGPYRHIRLCPDRRTIVYHYLGADGAGLRLAELESGRTRRILAATADVVPECLPQRHSISFVSTDPRWWPGLWSVSMNGGEPKRINRRAGIRYSVSADGNYAAYFDRKGAASPQRKATHIVVTPLDTRDSMKQFDISPTAAVDVPIRWMPGGDAISYADYRGGSAEIWAQPLTGGPPRQVTTLSGGRITGFDWSPDGTKLVVNRGMRSFDLLLLELGQ